MSKITRLLGPIKRIWINLLTLTNPLCALFSDSYSKSNSAYPIEEYKAEQLARESDSFIKSNLCSSIYGYETNHLDHQGNSFSSIDGYETDHLDHQGNSFSFIDGYETDQLDHDCDRDKCNDDSSVDDDVESYYDASED